MIKQKIMQFDNSVEMEQQINIALNMGWLVQSITVNSDTNTWIALLYREVA